MKVTAKAAAAAMLAVVFLSGAASAGPAAEFARQQKERALMKQEHTGEQFCWNVAYSMGRFVGRYRSTGDREWLDEAVGYFDLLISKMDTGPDGYKGFVGPYIYDNSVWCDVHVGDSIIIDNMLTFSELVLKDGELAAEYGDAARRYVDLAKKHLIEKWDSRGTFRTDGPYAGYVSWDVYCDPNDLTTWSERPQIKNSNLSLPFNKNNDMAKACMRIYRITGEQHYFDKAWSIFAYMRSRMQFFDDHYVWNYWEPFGDWDLDLDAGKPRHWVQVHPHRNYQSGEVADIVEAYHTGIVFTQQDIQRIINTNLEVMWNGDRENPQFYNSNATHRKREPGEGVAGTLWTSLADFSQTVRDLQQARRGNRGSAPTYSSPPSFERKHEPAIVRTLDFPTSECRDLHMAAVIGNVIHQGENSIIMSKAWMPEVLMIDVYSADGQDMVLRLFHGPVPGGGDGMEGFFIYQWDGVDPSARMDLQGDYRIRWTFRGGHREFPITIMKD